MTGQGNSERFEAVCEGCGLLTIVEWDGNQGLCDSCRRKSKKGGLDS